MPALKTFTDRCVGWMTPFSPTIGAIDAIGGWVKRHPPYDADERLR
jgi:hypothetical protein